MNFSDEPWAFIFSFNSLPFACFFLSGIQYIHKCKMFAYITQVTKAREISKDV